MLLGPAFLRSRQQIQAQTRLNLSHFVSINTGTPVVFVETIHQRTPSTWGILPPRNCIQTPNGLAWSRTSKKSLMGKLREYMSIWST